MRRSCTASTIALQHVRAALDVPAGMHRLRVWHPRQPDDAHPLEQPLQAGAQGTRAALKLRLAAAVHEHH